MPSWRFEPAIPAVLQLQIYASDHTATGFGLYTYEVHTGKGHECP